LPKLSRNNWLVIRGEYEAGKSAAQVAKEHGVSHTAVNKMVKKEGWTQDVEPIIKSKVSERVSGVVSGETWEKRLEAIEAEAERRAEVERRHREEPNACRERIYAGLKAHRAAATLQEKKEAFEDLKAAKISAEAMTIVHNMERKAWRLDTPETSSQQQSMDIQVIYVDETKSI
jgi:hypothetical protein